MTDFASGFVVVPILLHPNSRGAVTLRDADPLSPPRIDANYFTDTPLGSDAVGSDVDVLARGCLIAARIVGAKAMGERLGLPSGVAGTVGASGCYLDLPLDLTLRFCPGVADPFERAVHCATSLPFWRAFVRATASTLYHPVGTCGIGRVVDAELRVHGVRCLRVVDASVMPEIVSGNTNAATYMIAEKASAMIAAAHDLALTFRTGTLGSGCADDLAAPTLPPSNVDGSRSLPVSWAEVAALGFGAGVVGFGAAKVAEMIRSRL